MGATLILKKLIAEKNLKEAKKLIDEFILKNKKGEHISDYWYETSLEIAQKEKDTLSVRKISFYFLEKRFDDKFYDIYKSTFAADEWPKEMDKIINLYNKDARWFNTNVANVLVAEKEVERLMDYVAKHKSVDVMEKYYKNFAASYPEKTLEMFRQEIDQYAKVNMGRDHYKRVVSLLKEMIKIKGGKEVAKSMIDKYKIIYNNRRAMMEILNSF